MKTMKRLCALAVALVMTFAMTVTAFAGSIKINEDGAGHVYDVYQVLTGEWKSDTQLDNIQWGANITSEANAAAAFADVDAKTVVSVNKADKTITLGDNTYALTGNPYKTIEGEGYTVGDIEDGYYVIIDRAGTIDGNDDAYSAGIVKVAGNETVVVEPKSSTPTVDKEVLDEADDAEAGSTDGWGETADHAMYETYQYKLTAKLPNDKDLDEYEHYYLEFKDSLSAGITYVGNMTVTVNGTATTSFETTAVDGTDGPVSFTVTIQDLKTIITDLKEAEIVVTYDAYLNSDAVVGNEDDNQNTVSLEYSNDNEWDGTGKPTTGETGPDTVFVFTYDVDNTKIDGSTEAPLKDAEFRLYADEACTTEIALIFDSKKGAYRPVATGEQGTVMKSAEDGVFNIVGVDAGTYYLKETKAPTGYNDLEAPIKVVIVAAHAETSETEAATVIDQDKSQNTVNEVKNYSGATLPTTGGMGTTVIYVVGAILVIGAGVLLITRRRLAK